MSPIAQSLFAVLDCTYRRTLGLLRRTSSTEEIEFSSSTTFSLLFSSELDSDDQRAILFAPEPDQAIARNRK